jgi:4-hydroxythreonine-4-phosphate dehydrogenase
MVAPQSKPVIAVTPGEPGGIGPEVTAHLFAEHPPARSTALIIGAHSVMTPWLERYGASPTLIKTTSRHPGAADLVATSSETIGARGRRSSRVFLLDTGRRERYACGRDSRAGGRHSGFALDVACALASRGLVEGLVTGPISKRSLNLAGYPFTGHTELFARYFDTPDCQMVMVFRDFRVVPLTRHIPLSRVSEALTAEKIVTRLHVVNRALKEQFGVKEPHLAVAALNPHAGEGGVVGNEEIEMIGPALRRVRRQGIRITGPVPGDVLFQEVKSGTFDAFVVMYHDQGLIPFKMVSKRRGVNVTVGLPVVRTSVDHGVAYDIAGEGIAGIESLKEAYRLAERLVGRRRRHKGSRQWIR